MINNGDISKLIHKKSARRLNSVVGTGAKMRRQRKVEGAAQMRQA